MRSGGLANPRPAPSHGRASTVGLYGGPLRWEECWKTPKVSTSGQEYLP